MVKAAGRVKSHSKGRAPSNDAAKAYLLALTDPFNPGARGARVPDMFATPSVTGIIRGSLAFGEAGGAATQSNGVFAFLANPVVSYLADVGTNVGNPSGDVHFLTTGVAAGAVVPASLAAFGDSFRVVGGGILIKNKQASLTATGSLIVANVPTLKVDTGWQQLSSTLQPPLAVDLFLDYFGMIDSTPNGIAGLINHPSADEYEVSELLINDILVPFHVCDSRAFDWLPTYNQSPFNTTQFIGGDSLENAAGTTLTVALGGPLENSLTSSSAGWSSPMVNLLTFPASTNILEVEYIYHLEFQPNTGNAVAIMADAPCVAYTDPGLFQRIVSVASAADWSQLIPMAAAHSNSAHMLLEGARALYSALGVPAPMKVKGSRPQGRYSSFRGQL